MMQGFGLFFAILLLLVGLPARAADDHTLVVWDGRAPSLEIMAQQLDAMVADPKYKHYDEGNIRVPMQWFRLRIENHTDSAANLILRSTDPGTHILVLVEQPIAFSKQLPRETFSRRDRFPDSVSRLARIDLQLVPGINIFYLGTSSYLDMKNFQLIQPEQLHLEDNQFNLFAGFMLGGIILMMACALVLYASIGHQVLLFYAFYTFTLLPLLLNLSSLFGALTPPLMTDWMERHLSFTAQLAILGLMEFSLSILDVKNLKPRLYSFLRVQSGVALLMALMAVCLGTDRILLSLSQISTAVAILSLLTLGLKLSWQDIRSARFYILGLGAFLMGATVILISSFEINVEPLNPVLCIMAGAVLQFMLLPFGIRDRLKMVVSEKDLQDHQLKEARAMIHILIHDLSGPLFVIQSMAELQEGKAALDSKVRQSFEKIGLSAKSAQAMLKVVKELEAIEVGKLELNLRPVPLLAALQSTLETLQPKAEAKQVTIELKSRLSDVELKKLTVLAERTVLEHTIFFNLVANAIKFSKPDDLIQVFIEVMDRNNIAIRVKDHGIGIPKTLIVHLFSHSKKTSRKGTAGEKGTGLGLPLAQRYVQKFGGSLDVQSQAQEEFPEDHWTQFTVTLKKAG